MNLDHCINTSEALEIIDCARKLLPIDNHTINDDNYINCFTGESFIQWYFCVVSFCFCMKKAFCY
jgi:hypothetical protein